MKNKSMTYIAAALAVALVAAVAFGVYSHLQLRELRYTSDKYGEDSLGDLASALEAAEGALREAGYASSAPLRTRIFARAAESAEDALAAFSGLPCTTQEMEKVAGTINSVKQLSLRQFYTAAEGAEAEGAESLAELRGRLSSISAAVRQIWQAYEDGALRMDEYGENGDSRRSDTVGWELRRLEEETPAPSENTQEAKPPQEAEARRAAALFTGEPEQSLHYVGSSTGDFPCAYFTISRGEEEAERIAVAPDGQVALWYNAERPDSGETEEEEAAKTAEDFLAARGYTGLAEQSREKRGGLLVINYARRIGDTIFLPDTLTLAVNLDSGEPCALLAEEYLKRDRSEYEALPEISPEQALEKLPQNLSPQALRLVLDEVTEGEERLCYEIACVDGEESVHIFINAKNGEEEKILLQQT